MTLPSKPQIRAGMPPRRARVLLGAAAKTGKTTLLGNWAPNTTLIIDTHNGSLLLDGEHYVQHVQDWASFVKTIDDIVRGGHPFHTVGIDLIGDAYRFCDLHFGRMKDGLKVPASAMDDYGRSSAKAREAFKAQLGRLLAAPVGVWFLTHLREKTNRDGELTAYAPDLDKAIYGYIQGAVDFVWLAEVGPNRRRLVHTQPTDRFEAGSRGDSDHPVPSPLPMDAGELARALDRTLNPQDYDENGDRRKPEPEAPPVVPATETDLEPPPDDPTPTREIERVEGQTDVPAPDPWVDDIETRIKALSLKGTDLREALGEIGAFVPENVGRWRNVLVRLSDGHRAALNHWLLESESADTPLEV